jgi:hypothetical protein
VKETTWVGKDGGEPLMVDVVRLPQYLEKGYDKVAAPAPRTPPQELARETSTSPHPTCWVALENGEPIMIDQRKLQRYQAQGYEVAETPDYAKPKPIKTSPRVGPAKVRFDGAPVKMVRGEETCVALGKQVESLKAGGWSLADHVSTAKQGATNAEQQQGNALDQAGPEHGGKPDEHPVGVEQPSGPGDDEPDGSVGREDGGEVEPPVEKPKGGRGR